MRGSRSKRERMGRKTISRKRKKVYGRKTFFEEEDAGGERRGLAAVSRK